MSTDRASSQENGDDVNDETQDAAKQRTQEPIEIAETVPFDPEVYEAPMTPEELAELEKGAT